MPIEYKESKTLEFEIKYAYKQINTCEDIENATGILEKALEIYPDNSNILLNLADCYNYQKQPDKELDCYLKVLNNESSKTGLNEICKSHPFSNKFYRVANVHSHSIYTFLGFFHKEQNNTEEAIEYYKQAIKYSDNDFNAQQGIAKCYQKVKKLNLAIKHYKNAFNLEPDISMPYVYELQKLYMRTNSYQEGIQVLAGIYNQVEDQQDKDIVQNLIDKLQTSL